MSSNNAVEFGSPIGRYVQGSFSMQDVKDDNNQPKIDPQTGQVEKAVFFSVAFQKGTQEWAQFEATIKAAAAAFWPQFFPQGGYGPCIHPQFSIKIMDGDGVDNNGKANNTKPGFAGHWIVKFRTSFLPKVHYEGKFQPHEQIQAPDEVVKRGFYVRVIGQIKSNMAVGNQKPGIAIYPNVVIFCAQGEVIQTGINVADAAAKYAAGAMPTGATALPNQHPQAGIPQPTGAAVAPQVVQQPVQMPQLAPQVAPQVSQVAQQPQMVMPQLAPQQPAMVMPQLQPVEPQVSPALLAQYPGITYQQLKAQGHSDEVLRAQGWII